MRRCRRCRAPLPAPAATGRPRLYCSPACRKAQLRRARPRPFYATSGNDEWATPQALFDELDAEFGFTLDAAATAANAKCPRHFSRAEDGLAQPWRGTVFCNPPYAQAGRWLMRGYFAAAAEAATVVLLVPARTDTRWWHEWACRGEIRYLRGRLRFGAGSQPAPFPSALVVFRPGFRPAEQGTKPGTKPRQTAA